MRLTTEQQLAEDFGITAEKAKDLRQRHKWPHVRLGRFDVRYTDEQIAEIVRSRSVQPSRSSAAVGSGLTERSAARVS